MEERIKTIVSDVLGCDPMDIVPTANLKKDLGADSIDHAEIIKEFEITIKDEEWIEIITIQDLYDKITEKEK